MNPLIVCTAYCSKDIELVKNLYKWIAQLGGCPGHSCLLVSDQSISKEDRVAIRDLAKPSFYHVGTIPVVVPEKGFAPNHMFMLTAQQIMFSYKFPWLWLEPDAVPLKRGWLDKLAEEYAASPKRMLGPLVESNLPGLPKVHLTGVAIYPPDIFPLYDEFESIKNSNVAWDMEAAAAAVPRAKNSTLMQHFWGQPGLPPTFVKERAAGLPSNAMCLSDIKPDTVLFHRVKNDTLINLLREQHVAVKLSDHPTRIEFKDIPPAKRRGRPPKIQPAITQPA